MLEKVFVNNFDGLAILSHVLPYWVFPRHARDLDSELLDAAGEESEKVSMPAGGERAMDGLYQGRYLQRGAHQRPV